MKNAGLKAVIIGAVLNFALVVTKFYIGVSSNSLTIYCDAVNNLADTISCGIAILGFVLIKKMSERQSERLQSLCAFVINIFIAVTGFYFIYNGLERMMYPLPVAYSLKYVILLGATVFVKIGMGFMYRFFNKNEGSTVLRSLVLDSFLDCFITIAALMSLVLVTKVRFAVDGAFAIVTGSFIFATAVKGIINEGKYIVNN